MWPNPQFLSYLDTFTEKILNGKLQSFCAVQFEDVLNTVDKTFFTEIFIKVPLLKGNSLPWKTYAPEYLGAIFNLQLVLFAESSICTDAMSVCQIVWYMDAAYGKLT